MSFDIRASLFAILVFGLAVLPQDSLGQNVPPDTRKTDSSKVGYLTVDMPPRIDSLYVVVDQDFEDPSYVENGDTLALQVGERYVTLAAKNTRDLNVPTEIEPGKVQTIRLFRLPEDDQSRYLENSSYPVLRNNVNLAIVTDRDSRIFVDEKFQGTGVARLSVESGRHLIKTHHKEGGTSRRVVIAETAPPRLTRVTMYNKPSRATVRYLSPVPGLSQFYRESELKGVSIFAGFLATTIGAVHQSHIFNKRNQKYEKTRELYEAAATEENAFKLGNRTERLYNEARSAYWRRNIFTGLATATFLYSFTDAWLNHPEEGYRTPVSGRAAVEPLLGMRRNGIRLIVHL